jgi:uncharacterized protein
LRATHARRRAHLSIGIGAAPQRCRDDTVPRMDLTFLLIFLTAIVAGVFGSMLGIGGALVLVPVVTLFLGVPVKTAIGASIVSIIATSSAAQIGYIDRGITHTRLGMVLELATTLGAIAGGITAVLVSPRALQGLFAAILLWAAWGMRRRGGAEPAGPTGLLDAGYTDPADGRRVEYGVRHLPLGLALSFVAGNVSGLLGVGGGVVKMPVMNVIMRMPLKAAIATSNFTIGVTAATSAAIYFGRGYVDPKVAVPTALGILIGAPAGPRIAGRLPSRVLRMIMVLALLAFAVQMVIKAASG